MPGLALSLGTTVKVLTLQWMFPHTEGSAGLSALETPLGRLPGSSIQA